jgi:enamine deaminase RidA (YjgF/YER057c/UK114 family)
VRLFNPPEWSRPRGYSNGVTAYGQVIFVAGQVGSDSNGELQSNDLVGQVRQALVNIVAILAEAGAKPEHIVRMNWYLTNTDEYNTRQAEIGVVYRELIGRHFPAMTAVQVCGFVEKGALVEIEATAILPAQSGSL